MADRTLLFKTDAGKEVNAAQVLEPRVKQAEVLGAKTVDQLPLDRVLARDKDGNLVACPILTDMLNTDFVTVLRHDMDGKEGDGMFVTFATTSNAENGGVDPEKSLLVSMSDLIVAVEVPAAITADVTSETLTGDPLCKYFGKPIRLDGSDVQEAQWKLISERTVRLHKNNGQSVGGKWELDLEAIETRNPQVLHLEASAESEYLSIALDPSKLQTIPVIFTPEDGQDQFKLLLFIEPFDQRPAQKKMKISNSTAEPAEAMFLRPWVIMSSALTKDNMTGAKGEGGKLKVAGLTNCVKAVDAEDGSTVSATVTVIPDAVGFNTTGELDAIKLPSVPAEKADSQLQNLVEDGLFTIKATVSAVGYETQEIELAVCINAIDQRGKHFALLGVDELDLAAVIANAPVGSGELVATTRHNEDDKLKADALASAVSSGITGKDGSTDVALTIKLVDELGAADDGGKPTPVALNPLFVVSGEIEPTGYVLVKCTPTSATYVECTIKVPVDITDKRLPDAAEIWTLDWDAPSLEIVAAEEGKKLSAVVVKAVAGVPDSSDPDPAIVAPEGFCPVTLDELATITNQWGETETVNAVVVGVVDSKHPLSPETCDVVSVPEGADTASDGNGCLINVSILTVSGRVIVKKVHADVVDNRAE